MDLQFIRDHRLIDRYVREKLTGQKLLSDAEADAFEVYYLEHPEILPELEAAETALAGQLSRKLKEPAPASAPGVVTRLNAALRSPQYAMAASVLMVLGFGLSGILYQQLQQGGDAGPVRLMPLVTTRALPSDESPNQFPAPPPGQQLVLLADPGPEDFPAWQASIDRLGPEGPQPIVVLGGLEPGYDGMLAIGLPARLLSIGDYEIRIAGQTGGPDGLTPVGRIRFRIVE